MSIFDDQSKLSNNKFVTSHHYTQRIKKFNSTKSKKQARFAPEVTACTNTEKSETPRLGFKIYQGQLYKEVSLYGVSSSFSLSQRDTTE